MAARFENVIVFGPSGDVASAAAIEAGARGAQVWLAMRDTNKALHNDLEDPKIFHRIQADLSDPRSVESAIKGSGAKAAFIYRVQTSDSMATTLKAMRDAGVVHIVFLSSFTITQGTELRDVPASKIIPHVHATVEIQLEDLDISHVALRPGNFASNGFKMYLDTSTEPYRATVSNGKRLTDNVVPRDIGRIGGAVLVDRPEMAEKKIIYVFGPELMTYEASWQITKEQWDREIEILDPGKDGFAQSLIGKGFPSLIANYLAEAENRDDIRTYYPGNLHSEGWGNIKKYSGHEATKFRDYISEQKP